MTIDETDIQAQQRRSGVRDDDGGESGSLLPPKVSIVSENGQSYLQFRASMRPLYGRAWAQIVVVYLVLLVGLSSFLTLAGSRLSSVVLALAMSVVFGTCVFLLSLYTHGASHWNLASERRVNDALADVFLGPVFGLDVATYRRVHFTHHRRLGRDGDPENGYEERLDLRFFVVSITGLRFAKSLLRHIGSSSHGIVGSEPGSRRLLVVRVFGLGIHGVVVCGLALSGHVAGSLAWIIGYVVVAPTLASMRLIMEHRVGELPLGRDELRAVTRSFRGLLLPRLLGAAGFRRHLLHHWDPLVHFTRLRDVESYLRSNGLDSHLEASTTTYLSAARKLYGN